MNGINVFDWTAGPFLTLYAVLYLVCLVASFRIAATIRPEGSHGALADAEEAAVLGPGLDRLGEVVVARLLERGALTVERGKLVKQPGASGEDGAERAVLALSSPIGWSALRRAIDATAQDVDRRLVRRGLLMERGEARTNALITALPLIGLLLLGLGKALIGSARGHAVGYLVLFMVVTALTIMARWLTATRKTRGGEEALLQAVEQADRLKLAPAHGEAAMAVALFGTGVLATSTLGDFHRMRANSGDGGGDGGSSSGDGGSGCGAGGCGGCGG